MSNRAWMPLHITDYLADTGHLNAAEHGAYLMLIMHYWQNGSLPADERLLARLARMSKAEWDDSRDVLAMLFGPNWTHKRIDAELTKADGIIEKRRNAALGRHAKSKEDASAVHVQSTSTDTGVPPRTLNQAVKEEPSGSSKKRGCRLPADFIPDQAWAVGEGLSASQAQSEAAKFRDYWNAKAGASATKLDWPGTWRNWVRQALERMPQAIRGSPAKASSSSALSDSAERLVQSMRSADEIRSGSRGPGIPALISHLPVR
jgi:uncharacterized protein YdaU (DUF1376 family)